MSRIEGWSSSQGQTPGLEAWLYHLTDRGPWVIKLSCGKCIIRVFEGLIHRNLLKTLHAWQQTKANWESITVRHCCYKKFHLCSLANGSYLPSTSSAPEPGAVSICQRAERQWRRGEVRAFRRCPPLHLQRRGRLLLCNLTRYMWMALTLTATANQLAPWRLLLRDALSKNTTKNI